MVEKIEKMKLIKKAKNPKSLSGDHGRVANKRPHSDLVWLERSQLHLHFRYPPLYESDASPPNLHLNHPFRIPPKNIDIEI